MSRATKTPKNVSPQWPPPVWPPVGYQAPPLDAGEPDLIGSGLVTPMDRAIGLFSTSLIADDQTRPDDPYMADPVGWILDRLGEYPWSKQRTIARSVLENRRTAVPSAHETGKSWLAARIISWWLSTHRPGEAFAVTTAPSASQVRAILWREINRAHRAGALPGRTNQTEWWIDDELVGFGRKPADYSPTAFQGIHAKYVLVVLDEACGIPVEIWRAANSLVANEYGRMLAIGNPDDPTSYFATICGPDTGWNVLPVSAFETPNFTGEPVPDALRPLLVSSIYTDELARDVGVDSPIYLSKALGQFPENAANGVVPLSMVRACQQLDRDFTYEQQMPVELGMDVGAGGDQTVIRERRGPVAARYWRRSTPNWADAVAVALEAIRETGASRIKIDTIGIGWGVVGRLKELRREGKHACDVIPVNVGVASTNPERFPRLRDQLWWEIGRELSRAKAWDLSALDDTTVNQLISPQWQPDSAGRIHVEPKGKTIERLHRSPDDADALLLAYYTPVLTKPFHGAAGGQRMKVSVGVAGGSRLVVPNRRRPGVVVPFRPAAQKVAPNGKRLPNPYRRRHGVVGGIA